MRRRRILVGLFGLLAVAVCVLGAAALYLRTARPPRHGTVVLPGLQAPVIVLRDSLGVPHIRAATEHDLFFAQGYVHAQERLWQMELVRRVVEGRLAELFGPDLVESDRFLRTIGLSRAARAQEAGLDADTRAALDAYTAGVNAWLRTRRGALPPEFLVLRFEPEPWTAAHSLGVERVMGWDLALYGRTHEAARAAQRLGPDRARHLDQGWPDWAPVIMDAALPATVPGPAAALLDAYSIRRASNAWVIGGEHTRSGRPILANDMHLALRAPSLWKLMALHGGRTRAAGVTLPGVPFVVAGRTPAVAWGFTNASLDDVDLFVIRPDPTDAGRYLVPGGSEPFEVLNEAIRVRGADPVPLAIRLTRHGPILPGVDAPDSGADLIAMRWTGQDSTTTAQGLAGFNRARSAAELRAAVPLFDGIHQNVVYADTAGDWGYVMAGRIPRRGDGRPAPMLPVPGWTGDWDWDGRLPFAVHPQVARPARGYVVTANHRQAAGDAADRISAAWEPPFRAERITQLVSAPGPFDADAVHTMQLDVHDAFAARYRALAVRAARAAGLDDRAAALEAWDLEVSRDSRAAAFFRVWADRLERAVAADLYEGEPDWFPLDALTTVLDQQRLPWRVDDGAAALDSIAAGAAVTAHSVAGARTWGQLHTIAPQHALGGARLLDRILRLNVGPAPGAGSPTTVNVSHYTVSDPPLRTWAGASHRHVVDLADPDGPGGFITPTGASGLPFEFHYRSQWRRWVLGGLWQIPLDSARAEARAVRRLVLQPAAP